MSGVLPGGTTAADPAFVDFASGAPGAPGTGLIARSSHGVELSGGDGGRLGRAVGGVDEPLPDSDCRGTLLAGAGLLNGYENSPRRHISGSERC